MTALRAGIPAGLLRILPFLLFASAPACGGAGASGPAGDGGGGDDASTIQPASEAGGGSTPLDAQGGAPTDVAGSMSEAGNPGGPTDAVAPPPQCPSAPSGITSDQSAAYAAVNNARVGAGSPCSAMVPALNTSTSKHCTYYSANEAPDAAACIASPHVEVQGCASYYAANWNDRETMAGYMGNPTSEDMHFLDNGAAAVQGWLDTIYHRYPVLDPWERDFGYGNSTGCDTMDFGSGAATPATVVAVYPYDGQKNVPTSFDGAESPAPPAPPGGWPSGYPISIFVQGTVAHFTITKDGSVTAEATLAVPLLSYQPNAQFMYTTTPLVASTKYNVHADGSNGAAFTKDWSFTTAP
jgi:hypothetical protein